MNPHALLAYFPKITFRRHQKLAAFFQPFSDVWQAEVSDFIQAGIEAEIAHELAVWRETVSSEKTQAELERENIAAICINESTYPPLLRQIADPPFALFVRGLVSWFDQPAVAVVGTRKSTTYGKQVCQDLVGALAQQGVVIISGLALGIDGIAHQATVDAGGTTIAVLGSGVSNVYPSLHRPLAQTIIASGGAIISEYPSQSQPTQYSFPARNRIIAGLTLGTLVIEAPQSSGALITAYYALDYNRDVFAIPHALTSPTGIGPNNLIKRGAHLVTSASDIVDILQLEGLRLPNAKTTTPRNSIEAVIISALGAGAKHIDELIQETGHDSATINSALTVMEISGTVRNLGSMLYALK